MSYRIRVEYGDKLQGEYRLPEDFSSESIVIGSREGLSDVVVNHSTLSRQHLRLTLTDSGELEVADLMSTNGTSLNGKPLAPSTAYLLTNGDNLELGGDVVRISIAKVIMDPAKTQFAQAPLHDSPIAADMPDISELFKTKKKILFGRSEECDVFLDHPSVSRQHASLENLDGGRYRLQDLNSLNGTFYEGDRIEKAIDISDSDKFFIGRFSISIRGKAKDLSRESAISTTGVMQQYPNGYVGLQKTSLSLPSKSLVAIMGPSGCGKSTLLKTLNGEAPPTQGQVRLFGLELIKNYNYLKTQIGYVPQDDIIHLELSVYQCLYYSAKLRMRQVSKEQINSKIDEVLANLNILHIKHSRVGEISGGQRKRVSIAVELLTSPMILFLDEPTSPLDPQTIEEFLGILRRLAEQGTTVVMVTHKPEDLEYMDKVIFMAEGGSLVYFGPVGDYRNYFSVNSPVEVYANIIGQKADSWVTRYRQSHEEHTEALGVTTTVPKPKSSGSSLKQFWWLTKRYLKIKTNDKVNSLIMLAQAPIIAALLCLIFDHISLAVPFLIAVSALWFGTNNAAREIVGESAVFRRERMFNLKLVPYLASKLVVLTLVSAIQSFLFIAIVSVYFAGDEVAWTAPLASFLWMVLIALTATLMGLVLSAAVNSTEKVMTLVPLALIPQIMLAGVVTKITSPLVEVLSYFTLSRWGTEGLAVLQENIVTEKLASTGSEGPLQLVQVVVSAPDTLGGQFYSLYRDLFGDWAGTFALDVVVVLTIALGFAAAVLALLKSKDSI